MRAKRIVDNGVIATGAVTSVLLVLLWIDAIGVLVGIATATFAVVSFMRRAVMRAQRWFVHGYHAGYHAAAHIDCTGRRCLVLDAAEARVEQMAKLAGHG